MKYLIIENGRGFYTLDGEAEHKKLIADISKDDLLNLLTIIVDGDEFEMDEYDESVLLNPADQIIYNSIYENLDDVIKRRKTFEDEKNSLYREAIEKYCRQIEEIEETK